MKNHQSVFDLQLISLLPRLRIQALALTRNPSAAADLVQDAVTNALGARGSFTPGTNFPAWMHRILRNRFISDTRKRRPSVDMDDVPEAALATPAAHEDRLVLKELHRAIGRLPLLQRESLFMVVLHGMSYEQVAEATGCAVGTAKSRVFRARQQLQLWLTGETPSATAGRPQPWPEGVEADAPAHPAAVAAFTTGEPSATRTGHGTPDARRACVMLVAEDAPC
jgi:RNA polymerase sigma-70 factor (ECF subfamily)